MITPPTGRDTPPFPEIDVLWITAGLGCDGDTIAMTAATQPSIEDMVLGGIPVDSENTFPQSISSHMKTATTSCRYFIMRRKAKLRPSSWSSKGRFRTKKIKQRATGRPSELISKRGSRSPPAIGSIAWRRRPGRWWLRVRAPPTAAFTPWKAIPRDAWAYRTIWAGTGNRRPASPSFAFPDARCSRTISWRRCCICCTWPRDARR